MLAVTVIRAEGKPLLKAFVVVRFRWLFGLLGALIFTITCLIPDPDCELQIGRVLITLPIWRGVFLFAGTFCACLSLFLPTEYAILVIKDKEQ